MRSPLFLLILAGVLLLMAACQPANVTPSPTTGPRPPAIGLAPPPKIPHFSHVVIITMENKDYADIMGSPATPYINSLANHYASADAYYGITHPSLPNYLALTGGDIFGIHSDCLTCRVAAPSIVDQLEAHGKTWRAYIEDLPSPCSLVMERGLYSRKHNPLMYYDSIRQNPTRCQQIVPLTQFDHDLAAGTLPDYVWISPNLCHDMHSCARIQGDDWLASFVPKILQSPAWKNGGVLFLLWDEGATSKGCCNLAAGGHIPAVIIAADGKRGYRSAIPYDNYSVLRTIEDSWGFGYLRNAGDPGTLSMSDFFS